MADLTDLVRTSCRAVVAGAELITIDDDALDRLAGELVRSGPPTPDGPGEPAAGGGRADPEAAVALVIALDAINFGSGWHDVVRKRPGLSGARTMAAALRDHAARSGRLTAGSLRTLTPEDCAAIFDQEPGGAAHELMARFAAALVDLGALVEDRFGGSFLALVEEAAGSAVALAQSLLAMPAYRDRVPFEGQVVHFYKRAQITPADLAREVPAVAACRFGDLDRLTAFADNLVPHVLRVDGVLRYDPDLADTIDAGTPLVAGSPAEVEIRAAGVEAVERLVAALGRHGTPWRAMDVDLTLWQRGAGPTYKAVRRHRARSTSY